MEHASVTLNISEPRYVGGAGIYEVGALTCSDGTRLGLFMNILHWRPTGYLLAGALPEEINSMAIGNYRFRLEPICPSLWLVRSDNDWNLDRLDKDLRLGCLDPVAHFGSESVSG